MTDDRYLVCALEPERNLRQAVRLCVFCGDTVFLSEQTGLPPGMLVQLAS